MRGKKRIRAKGRDEKDKNETAGNERKAPRRLRRTCKEKSSGKKKFCVEKDFFL